MPIYRFDNFQVDTDQAELRRDGTIVPVAPQVIQLLTMLLEKPGEVIRREDLQLRLWPATHTDRERGLNNAVNRLRDALGDSAASPRWIVTIPKRGYRFIGLAKISDADQAKKFDWRWRWVAAAIVAALILGTSLWLLRPQAVNSDAPAEYWAALNLIRRGAAGDLHDARDLLNTCIRKQPSYGPAYAELAPIVLELVDQGLITPALGRAESTSAARTAVRLRPDSVSAHLAMASVVLRISWDLQGAEREVNEALRIDPKSAEAWRYLATVFLARGRADRAVEAAERSVALDPASPWARTASGRALFYSRDTERSTARLEETLASNPNFGPAHHYLTEVYWESGRRDDARREFIRAMRLSGAEAAELRRIDAISSEAGLAGLWRSELPQLRQKQNRQGVPYILSVRLLEIGEPEHALDWLERAFDQKDVRLLFLRVNPQFDALRGLPRFEKLVARVPV
jgi:DNA-binding winged helix-turn-helix (wHTH) protein/tetratricopeptide (TPR) repeat protein